jgi:hypothetical protein
MESGIRKEELGKRNYEKFPAQACLSHDSQMTFKEIILEV